MNELLFKDGLIPAIIVDEETNEVLMLAYMNEESLKKTIEEGRTWFFSRTRNKLWLKGETSGCFQDVSSIYVDCDRDTLLIKVSQTGNACHTGNRTCFFEKLHQRRDVVQKGILSELYNVILLRKKNPKEGSYTTRLFKEGKAKIYEKLREELEEVILEGEKNNKDGIIYETADLLYHLFVLLGFHEINPNDVLFELKRRRK
ncbi:MAG: bifunctional phosphoribosyl-AMP cyclohydrolase/phosphoribosyl-ATP diphosphatase HisIE [bacterium]